MNTIPIHFTVDHNRTVIICERQAPWKPIIYQRGKQPALGWLLPAQRNEWDACVKELGWDKTPLQHALTRAADWLEANPGKHITGRLTDRGYDPFNPEASCFCGYGRAMYELDAVGEPVKPLFHGKKANDSLNPVFAEITERYGLSFYDTWTKNDDNENGRAKVIAWFRELAK